MIAETQAALLDAIRQTLGKTVKFVEPHPGDWSTQTVQRIIMSAPSVYVAWLGVKPSDRPQQIVNEWVVFIAAQTLNGIRADGVGTYQITERLMSMFAGRVPGVNAMRLTRARNLWSEQQSASGSAIYALYYDETSVLTAITPEEGLDDFLRHWQQYDQGTGAPLAEDHINLPGPGENHEEN
ncbi:phage protein Gp37 [Rahnella contaminans]|uniref:phage protein Gp37 n=1 Tax=Rahnella contaminans TaxID=2703882 RepID=UPI003C2AD281